MICPDCNRSFDGEAGSCPRCGALSGTVKTSTIFISTGDTESVYRSVEDVPEALKRQLIRSTNGLNSRTIVIADRLGRKELARAIRNLPAQSANRTAAEGKLPLKARIAPRAAHAIGALLLAIAVALVWLIFHRIG
jgi:hypothetical protein